MLATKKPCEDTLPSQDFLIITQNVLAALDGADSAQEKQRAEAPEPTPDGG